MKVFIVTALLAASMVSAFADQSVSGYTRRDGTYVAPYTRSSPDGNPWNNYGSQGNVSPSTGRPGTRDPTSWRPNDSSGPIYDQPGTPSSIWSPPPRFDQR